MLINMKNLGFGLMRLPLIEGENKVDIARVCGMVDTFIQNGFTYFDTAAIYHGGESEIAFREAVAKRYPRESYVIADKLSLMAIAEKKDVAPFFEKHFEALGVSYIDYYLLHALGKDSYAKAERFGAFEFVKAKKEEGRLKHIGFSFHDSPEVLEEILSHHPEMEFVQLQVNYLDWEDAGVASRRCIEVAKKYGKPVIVMEPVKGGALADFTGEGKALITEAFEGASPASVALRFAASADGVFMVLSGMSNEAQLADNIAAFGDFKPLTEAEKQTVLRVGELIRANTAVPCTACRYCVDDCPKKIAIPEYFSAYNTLYRFGESARGKAAHRYGKAAKDHGKASDCISCGKCEKHCPQHIAIREKLKEVAKEFDA